MNGDPKEFVAFLRSGATLVIHPDDMERLLATKSLSLMTILVEAMIQNRIIKHEWVEPGTLIAYKPDALPDFAKPPANWH